MDERWYCVAYDVPDDRRRERVASWLEGWGERVQKSVFELELRPAEYQRMRQGLLRLIDREIDSVRVYHLGYRGYRQIETLSGQPAKPQPRFLIIG
jgi:CRISPR-associated protein Cas2